MKKYRLTPEAREDFRLICRYVAERNPRAAKGLSEKLYKKLNLIARSPGIGQRRNDLGKEVRIFLFEEYVVIYRFAEGVLTVLQILHQSRDLPNALRPLND